jgi:hypothetical protein
MVDRVFLVHRSQNRVVDGIRDHGKHLAAELSGRGITVEERCDFGSGVCGDVRKWLALWRRLSRAGRGSTAALQYSPFCFARWGFAPWLPMFFLALRFSPRRPIIAVIVHEPYVPMISWRWTLMGLWQRLQLAAIRLSADIVFTSIYSWARKFAV